MEYKPLYRVDGTTTRCKSCGAKIQFIVMSSGKMMPLNPEVKHFRPWFDGDSKKDKQIFVTDYGTVFAGIEVDDSCPDTLTGRISHFATCPNAAVHRKR